MNEFQEKWKEEVKSELMKGKRPAEIVTRITTEAGISKRTVGRYMSAARKEIQDEKVQQETNSLLAKKQITALLSVAERRDIVDARISRILKGKAWMNHKIRASSQIKVKEIDGHILLVVLALLQKRTVDTEWLEIAEVITSQFEYFD